MTGNAPGEGRVKQPSGKLHTEAAGPERGVKDPLSHVTLGKSRNLQVSVPFPVEWGY